MSPWLSDLFLRSQTDERLVALARSGQSRAFTAIVERYRRELLAFAHRLSPDRAEDLVQQTFLSAFGSLQRDAEVRHLRGWLYQILRNMAARESASWMVSDEIGEDDVVAESAEHAAERRMLAVDALGAVAALPPTQHVALVQTAIQGRSRTEVADVLGLSEGAVRQLVHRARATLRAAVTAITPLPLGRWFANRSSGGPGFSEATLGAGTASTAGLTLKLGIGALLATGVVATSVVTVVSSHRRAGAHGSRFLASDGPGGGPRRATHPTVASGLAIGRFGPAVGRGASSAQHGATSRLTGTGHDPARAAAGSGNASSGGSPGSVGVDGSGGASSSGSGDSSGGGSQGGSGGSDGGGTTSGGSDGGGTSSGSGSDGGGTSSGSGSDGGGTSSGSGSDGGGTTQLEVSGATDGGSGGSDGGSSGSLTSGTGSSSGSDGGSGSISGVDGSGSGDGGGTTSGSSGG